MVNQLTELLFADSHEL